MKLSEELEAAAKWEEDHADFWTTQLRLFAKRAEILEDTIRIGRYKFDVEIVDVQ